MLSMSAHLHELRIGALIQNPANDSFGKMAHAAVDLAVKSINADASILKHYKLKYSVGDSGCSGVQTVGEFARLVYQGGVNVVIGPSCDEGCLSGGFLATYHNLPMISHSCSTSEMSNTLKYPTFGRVRAYASASIAATAQALARFFKEMGWSRLGILHSNEDTWTAAVSAIKDLLTNMSMEVRFDKDYIEGHAASSADACMMAVKKSGVRSEYS